MKINRTGYAQFVKRLEKSNSVHKTNSNGEKNDKIEISEASRKIKEYSDVIKASESANADKIESIRAKLDSGTYQISSKQLADRILDEIKSQMAKEK